MSVRVERAGYDPENGFLYYVVFKPNLELGEDEVFAREDVEVSVSLSETGDLADLSFVVPKMLRSMQALSFICAEDTGRYVEPHAFVTVPGISGDSVVSIPGRLELDQAGRIVGMAMQWQPSAAYSA
ncbi:MAG: hypothetical protein P4M01_12100 [Acidobacteriota bacterium]|nr:hypothetical protein [Acidobacteriota bacterium]